jgi:hypothetical protein
MLPESLRTEVQRQVALALAAHEQSMHSRYPEFGTPQKKAGRLFSRGQVVTYKKTGHYATVLDFPGRGRVTVRSHYNGSVYTRHYSQFKE